jgi:hypothetical protein
MSVPTGYLLAWLCRDELIDGQKWFYAIVICSVMFGGWFFLIGERVIGESCLFIAVVGFISLMKSSDKKWAVKRIYLF